jgi:hypothetical protein
MNCTADFSIQNHGIIRRKGDTMEYYRRMREESRGVWANREG